MRLFNLKDIKTKYSNYYEMNENIHVPSGNSPFAIEIFQTDKGEHFLIKNIIFIPKCNNIPLINISIFLSEATNIKSKNKNILLAEVTLERDHNPILTFETDSIENITKRNYSSDIFNLLYADTFKYDKERRFQAKYIPSVTISFKNFYVPENHCILLEPDTDIFIPEYWEVSVSSEIIHQKLFGLEEEF